MNNFVCINFFVCVLNTTLDYKNNLKHKTLDLYKIFWDYTGSRSGSLSFTLTVFDTSFNVYSMRKILSSPRLGSKKPGKSLCKIAF